MKTKWKSSIKLIDRNCCAYNLGSGHYCIGFFHRWFFLILIGQGMLSGCYSAWVSQGMITPNAEWKSQAVMAGSSLYGQDIELFVKVGNSISSSWDNAQHSTPFGISLWFDPKALYFELNPNHVFLQMPDKAVLSPARIITADVGSNVEASGWGCYGKQKAIDIKLDDKYVLRRGSCFEFYFDTMAPSPDAEFSMRIEGLARNGQKVAIPEIQFRKGSFKVMGFPFFRP